MNHEVTRMKNAFRKGFLLGVGLARMSADKLSKEVKKFAKEHNLTRKEAEELSSEFVHHFEKERSWVVSEYHRETRMLQRKFRSALASESKRVKAKARKIASRTKKRILRS